MDEPQAKTNADRKREALVIKCRGVSELTMSTYTNDTHYVYSLRDQDNRLIGDPVSVPLIYELKTDLPGAPVQGWREFFYGLGCLTTQGNIDMTIVNKIKQALDCVKDGTHKELLKKINIWDFGDKWQHIKYPDTLHSLEHYFLELFKSKGMCTELFWPRHGVNTSINDPNELVKVDCGPDPVDIPHHKGISDPIDPLPHGVIKPYDVVFPTAGITIKFDSSTLVAAGYPAGCAITAKCLRADVGIKSEWDINVTCTNINGQSIRVNDNGIYMMTAMGEKQINTKAIKTLKDTIRGNAFKSLTQQGKGDALINLLINMVLVYNKSWGDYLFFLEELQLAILGVNATTLTCDKVLWTTILLGMIQSGAVLTTNHSESEGAPTGNLSTRFRATELTPRQELDSIWDSCLFENNAYLRMLKILYNDARGRRAQTIPIKLGGETHDVNLWFLVTIIKTIEEMLNNHIQIMSVFTINAISQPPVTEEWRQNKQYILQLLKSYCKIVFPFVKKNNGEWTVFCQSSLISKFPTTQAAVNVQITSLISGCAELNENNKNALTKQMNLVLTENGISITIGKISMQQYALIVKKYFNHSHSAKLPEIAAAQGGGGLNMRRDNIKIGGMDRLPPPYDKEDNRKRGDSEPGDTYEVQSSDSKKLKPVLLSHEAEEELRLIGKTKEIFNIEHFKTDIAQIQISASPPRSLDLNSEMGFSPKAFDDDDDDDDDDNNTKIFKLIMLSEFFSQILKLISYTITLGINNTAVQGSGAGAAEDPEAADLQNHQYMKCIAAMDMIRNNKFGNSDWLLWGLAISLNNRSIYQQPLEVLGHLYSDIKKGNVLVIKKLTDAGFNPSSDTIEVAITSFNLSIREILRDRDLSALHYKYYSHQETTISRLRLKDHLDYTTITELEKMMTAEYRTSLYENILNIAYNVVLNHEYFLPLTCDDQLFKKCFDIFIESQIIDLHARVTAVTVEPATGPIAYAAVPSSPSPPQTHSINPVSNVFNSSLSSQSLSPSPASSQGDSPSRQWVKIGKGEWVLKEVLGGSTTRTRRKLHRNHRRTQYTNKNKRSSKSTKYNTIKHRKSYRKHNRTIKRRKNSRRRK